MLQEACTSTDVVDVTSNVLLCDLLTHWNACIHLSMFKLPKYIRCACSWNCCLWSCKNSLWQTWQGLASQTSSISGVATGNARPCAVTSLSQPVFLQMFLLGHKMQYLNGLQRLAALTVRCKALPAIRICSTSLSPPHARLRALSLTSGDCMQEQAKQNSDKEDEEAQETGAKCSQDTCTMTIEHLGMFLQPIYACLQQLHIDHCHIPSLECNPSRPSLFSRFSCLHTLQLNSIRRPSDVVTGRTTLNLSGCTALRNLNTCSSSFTDVDLISCNSLVSLTC